LLSVDVLTYHNDLARTGQNNAETLLTPANVNASTFGKQFSYSVDGYIYAQPLVASGVAVPGQGNKDLVFVATEHDSVYAYNADTNNAPNGGLVWHDSFINAGAGITTVPATDVHTTDIVPEIGITSTPVIDRSTNTIYVVAKTKEVSGGTTQYFLRLHALDLSTGAEKFGGPVALQATVPGTGDGGSTVSFNAFLANQRSGLLLLNGSVYIASASHGDNGPYHGWLLGYNAHTLQLTAAWTDSANGIQGGIWMSGEAPAADSAGNIYLSTGNGTFDGGPDFGDSIVKLSTAGGGLQVVDYYTPANQAFLNSNDQDLGSGGILLLPDQSGTLHAQELVMAGKSGSLYLVDRNNMTGYHPAGDQIPQLLPQSVGRVGYAGNFSTPAYFNGSVYFQGAGDVLKQFHLSGGLLSATPVARSSTAYLFPGATPSISSNGASNRIVWDIL
jgi:hypothetical protein